MAQLQREQIAAVNTHYRLLPFTCFLQAQQELGVTSIELWAGAPHFVLGYDGYQDCKALKQLIHSYGLKVAVFTPESVTYPFPICTWSEDIRRMGMDYYSNGIRAAAELGAKIVPISCAGALKDHEPERAFDRAVDALRALGSVAAEYGVTLAVEPLCPDVSIIVNTLPELQRLLGAVAHPNVKAALDICAMRVAGETLEQWFAALGKDIIHIHFTDGRPEGHLVWGQGLHPLDDYVQILAREHYQGYLGLNVNIRGTWFDPALVDEKRGFVGTDFLPENYWFNPAAVDRKNLEALAPYLTSHTKGAGEQ